VWGRGSALVSSCIVCGSWNDAVLDKFQNLGKYSGSVAKKARHRRDRVGVNH
jgi:hypothetical protein